MFEFYITYCLDTFFDLLVEFNGERVTFGPYNIERIDEPGKIISIVRGDAN